MSVLFWNFTEIVNPVLEYQVKMETKTIDTALTTSM